MYYHIPFAGRPVVKRAHLRKNENPCTCPPVFLCAYVEKFPKGVVTRKPILPSEEELEYNSRSKSAKLRNI